MVSLNDVAYARGVLEVEASTYRHQRDQAVHALERVASAYDHGSDLDLDVTVRRAVDLINQLKERP